MIVMYGNLICNIDDIEIIWDKMEYLRIIFGKRLFLWEKIKLDIYRLL